MQTALDSLPSGSRVWVFAGDRELTAEDEARIAPVLERVLGVWGRKTPQARGCWEFRDRRFLVVGADESAERLSGCGIDAMMAWLLLLEESTDLRLLDRMRVFWRDGAGGVRSATRGEFRELLEAGEVGPRTPVFDTAISSVDALREGRFELPLEACWHAQLFLQRA